MQLATVDLAALQLHLKVQARAGDAARSANGTRHAEPGVWEWRRAHRRRRHLWPSCGRRTVQMWPVASCSSLTGTPTPFREPVGAGGSGSGRGRAGGPAAPLKQASRSAWSSATRPRAAEQQPAPGSGQQRAGGAIPAVAIAMAAGVLAGQAGLAKTRRSSPEGSDGAAKCSVRAVGLGGVCRCDPVHCQGRPGSLQLGSEASSSALCMGRAKAFPQPPAGEI